MSCPKCGAPGIVQILIRLHTEERLDFRSCNNCEHKFWATTDERKQVLPLDEVLTRAKVVKRTA